MQNQTADLFAEALWNGDFANQIAGRGREFFAQIGFVAVGVAAQANFFVAAIREPLRTFFGLQAVLFDAPRRIGHTHELAMDVDQLFQSHFHIGTQRGVVGIKVIHQHVGNRLCIRFEASVCRRASDDPAEQEHGLEGARFKVMAIALQRINAICNFGADLIGLAQALANFVVNEVATHNVTQV